MIKKKYVKNQNTKAWTGIAQPMVYNKNIIINQL